MLSPKITPKITDARALTLAAVTSTGVAQRLEHSLDKREVESSILSPRTMRTPAHGPGRKPGRYARTSILAAIRYAGVAQLVEHRSATPNVAGSSPVSRSAGRVLNAGVAQLVERRPSKSNVTGSNPVTRSMLNLSPEHRWCSSGRSLKGVHRMVLGLQILDNGFNSLTPCHTHPNQRRLLPGRFSQPC